MQYLEVDPHIRGWKVSFCGYLGTCLLQRGKSYFSGQVPYQMFLTPSDDCRTTVHLAIKISLYGHMIYLESTVETSKFTTM